MGGTYANIGNNNARSWLSCIVRRPRLLPIQNYQEKKSVKGGGG
jgi:hypothetical protein